VTKDGRIFSVFENGIDDYCEKITVVEIDREWILAGDRGRRSPQRLALFRSFQAGSRGTIAERFSGRDIGVVVDGLDDVLLPCQGFDGFVPAVGMRTPKFAAEIKADGQVGSPGFVRCIC